MSASSFPLVPVKFIGEIRSGGTPKSADENWGGDIPFVTPPDLNGLDGRLVKEWERSVTPQGAVGSTVVREAVILSCRAPIGHVGRVVDDVAFNQGCKAIRPGDEGSARFLAYSLVGHRKELEATGRGTTFAELSTIGLSSIGLPWPPGSERVRIADYLDRETGEIDVMIARLDGLAVALTGRRAGVVESRLAELFRGAAVPLWSVLRPVKDQGHASEEVLSVYRDYGVILKSSRDDNHNRTPSDLSSYQLVLPGDLVINKMKAWQGSLGVSQHRGIVSPDYQVARAYVEVLPEYLHFVLRSPVMIPQYRVRSTGVRPAQWRLYWDDFANLRIPLPPRRVQEQVVAEIDQATSQIDVMLTKVAELKELLIERRAALITDVVTGRKVVA